MAYYAVVRDSVYLAHHGIAGQKWGVRNGPPYPLERQVGTPKHRVVRTDLGREFLKGARTANIDKWGKSPNTNVLYVTGQSGSGKSTIAQKLSDKNTSAIHLDSYFDNPEGPHNKAFDDHLRQHLPDYKKLSWPKNKISLNDWGKVAEKFEVEIERFGASQYKNGRKVICEGVQLLDDTLRPDKSFFRDKPVAVTTTNALISMYRGRKRDNIKYHGLGDVVRDLQWYRETGKDVKNFKKAIKGRRSK